MSSDSSTESKPKEKLKAKPKDRLTVVIDPGTSLSKILYVINDGTVKWMTMGAECLTLPATSAESLPIDNGMGRPSDNAWVRLSKAVGSNGPISWQNIMLANYADIVN